MRTGGSHISNDRMRVKRKNEYAGKGLGEHWSPPSFIPSFRKYVMALSRTVGSARPG